jgi:hypothetical protein
MYSRGRLSELVTLIEAIVFWVLIVTVELGVMRPGAIVATKY